LLAATILRERRNSGQDGDRKKKHSFHGGGILTCPAHPLSGFDLPVISSS
jgi:hypothetical protein